MKNKFKVGKYYSDHNSTVIITYSSNIKVTYNYVEINNIKLTYPSTHTFTGEELLGNKFVYDTIYNTKVGKALHG